GSLRGAYLDTIGMLPTAEQTRAFLADPAPEKRDQVIDALLARPEVLDYWTHRWGGVLLVFRQRLPDHAPTRPAMVSLPAANPQPGRGKTPVGPFGPPDRDRARRHAGERRRKL